MGVIAEYIRRKLVKDIRARGLLVWLDKESEFTFLVDDWVELYRQGKFDYPIFAFRGSFLELMLQSQSVLAGKDMPKCVIHVPGFNEQEIKQTPLYEAYKAGQRWRISLETMIRESAQGRLSPDQIEKLLARGKPNLALAEEELENVVDAPIEIKKLLKQYGEEGLALCFIEDPVGIIDKTNGESQNGMPLLRDYFLKFLGLDDEWRKEWNPQGTDNERPADQADLLMSYLLCLEYASDLTIDAPSNRLLRLQKKSKAYRQKTRSLLKELRQKNPNLYIRWADQVEANLTQIETSIKPAELGHLDTFRFEADIFAREALILLTAGKWSEAQTLVEPRLPSRRNQSIANYFWPTQDVQRQWLWEWIEAAAELGMAILKVESSSASARKPASITELEGSYADKGWKLDRLHRRFAIKTERYNSVNAPLYFNYFVETRKVLNRLYRSTIDAQARLWNEVCENSGFLGPIETRQRSFFNLWVKPILGEKQKTALIIVDALRYELGKELVEILENEQLGKISIEPLLAELPTITSVGMNALIPTSDSENLTPLFDEKKSTISGFKSGQRQVLNPKSRSETLKELAGVDSAWITIDDFLKEDEKHTRKSTAKPLLVVTSREIDELGESGALACGIDYFEKGLGRIKMVIRKLKDSGFKTIIITTDHGFLLGDESLEVGKAPRLPNVDRRFAIDTKRTGENLVSVTFAEINYQVEPGDMALVFGRSTHLLSSRGTKGFYHGGNSLQERVIPVIRIKTNEGGLMEQGSYILKIQKQEPALGYQHLRVTICSEGIPGLFPSESIEIRMACDAGAEVLIGDVINAYFTGDLLQLRIDKSCDIYFKLTGTVPKARIRLESTRIGNITETAWSDDYFDVECRPNERSATLTTSFSSEIPDEFHTALHHLEKHGVLSEKFLTNTLGSDGSAPRKARKFAMMISEWEKQLPFNILIEQTPEGKEYRKY